MPGKTYFAPALRTNASEILNEFDFVASQKFFNEIFGNITGISAVLNKNRQIVYANSDFLEFLEVDNINAILGKRHGEAVTCVHSEEEEGGCGTSMACKYCGSVNAIMESQKTGMKTVKEARISTLTEGKLKSLDLNITSSPITLSGTQFFVLSLKDISAEKSRLSLERIFFHDLLNIAGGLNGLLTLLKDGADPEEAQELINLSEEASQNIIEEIMLHRQLRAAESGELTVKIESLDATGFLKSLVGKISFHEAGRNKQIMISDKSEHIVFETDRVLFQRVIINLLKNSLEATQEGGSITAGIEDNGTKIRFWVKNDGVIPHDIQMQLFQRSFSTKGNNRGIGTYSIKLLTENYLKGKVSFISNETEGTVFSVELNKSWA